MMKVRILVVDDEAEIREMVQRHFRFLGFEVDVAENGQRALEIMAGARFDVVISDIMMPVMTGPDMLREIRTQYPMTHVIMMTGYVTMDNALTCMRLGADTLIFKPLEDLEELEEAVARAVAHISHWLDLLKQLQTMKPANA
jgi:CheY-like chemotaxis protein